jgi:hypothetical protein
MMRSVYKLILVATALLVGCANADRACLDDDMSCITHPQNEAGGSTATQGNTLGDANTANANAANVSSVGPITNTLVVDNFGDANAFTAGLNSLSPTQKQSDDATMNVYALASADRLELQCNTTACYWYTLLAAQGSCLDLSQYTHLAVTVQGAAGGGGHIELQNNSADCASTSFTGSQSVDLATYTVFDNNPHSILIPLTAFANVDKVHSRAISVLQLAPGIPVYLSNIQFVTVSTKGE